MGDISTGQILLGVIIIINVVVSILGFQRKDFFNKYSFSIRGILKDRQWYRIITGGFLHVNVMHLILNMYVLYSFANNLVTEGFAYWPNGILSPLKFFLLYFVSLIAGNILPLYRHRKNDMYTAVGASGAVSGVVYALILYFPTSKMGLLFIPLMLPAVVFGVLYVIVSIIGMKFKLGNIGHDAHLSGAVAGLLMALLFIPSNLKISGKTVLYIMIPIALFVLIEYIFPGVIALPKKGVKNKNDADRKILMFEAEKHRRELNELLSEIRKNGIDSLSKEEKEKYLKLSGDDKDENIH